MIEAVKEQKQENGFSGIRHTFSEHCFYPDMAAFVICFLLLNEYPYYSVGLDSFIIL